MTESRFSAQDLHYRRGVVLGLTMGEAVLLLLFCLLLVFAVPLIQLKESNKSVSREAAELREQNASITHDLDSLREKLEHISDLISRINKAGLSAGIEDLTKEYTANRARMAELEQRLSVSEKLARAYQALTDEISPSALQREADPTEVTKKLAKEVALGRAIMKVISPMIEGPIDPESWQGAKHQLDQLIADASAYRLSSVDDNALRERTRLAETKAARLQIELSNSQGQLASAKKTLAQAGRGVQAVPCWPTAEGAPEYIFDVALTSNGLIVRDRKLPHRKAEQDQLPIQEIAFDTELMPGQFQSMTRRLFDWSVKNECRHFVRAFDRTGMEEKMRYKAQLQSVGSRFYYREILDEQF